MPELTISRYRRPSTERLILPVGLVCAAVLLGAVCGRLAASHYGTPAIEAFVGIPLVAAMARRPVVAVTVLLAVVASIFSYGLIPRVNIPGNPPVNLADVLLGAAVLGTIWRRPWRTWPPVARRFAIALLVLLALATVATVKTSLLGRTQERDALYAFRNFLYLSVALTIALECTTSLWRPILNAGTAFAGLTSIVAIAAAALPSVAHVLLSFDPVSVFSPNSVAQASGVAVGGTSRIRITGLFFIYAMLIPTLVTVVIVKDKWRWLRLVAFALMLGAVALSLNRNMYGGAVVGIFVTAILAGPRVRFRLAMIAVATVVTATLVVTASITPAVTAQVGKRGGTVLAPSQILQSNSLLDRAYELGYAIPSIARHPWFGVGPRQYYGAVLQSRYATRRRFFVQNLYVYLATDYGIPTGVAFIFIPGICLCFGFSRVRLARDPIDRALLGAAIGTLLALAISCLVDTFVQDPPSTMAFGTACGLVLAAGLRIPLRTGREAGI